MKENFKKKSEEVKNKVKSMGPVKIIILIIMAAAFSTGAFQARNF